MGDEIIEFRSDKSGIKPKGTKTAKPKEAKAAKSAEIREYKIKSKKSSTKIGAVIILIISAVVFIPFGASAIFESFANRGDRTSFGSYNGHQIIYEAGSTFATTTANLATMYQNAGYETNEYSIMYQAFRETVTDMMFRDEVSKAGYEVPNEAVNRAVIYSFTDPDTGKFSQKLYNQASEAEVTQARTDAGRYLIYERYRGDLFGTNDTSFNGKSLYGLKRSRGEMDFLAGMGTEKHAFDAVLFDLDSLPEEEIAAYGNSHADKFVQYDLSIITIDDEESAASLLRQINANEITFDDAAAEDSQGYYADEEHKAVGKHYFQIENILDDTSTFSQISALKTGEISPLIKTKRGYSIFRCDGPSSAADFTDEDVQETVHYYIDTNEKSYAENYFVTRAQSFITQAAADSFDAACEAFGVEKATVDAFPVNYGPSTVYAQPAGLGDLDELTSDANTYTTAFSLRVNEISEPIVLDSNVVVLKCTGIQNDEPESVSESEIANTDASAADQALFASDKVVDNFSVAYYALVMQNRQ